jgi:hypothetical protein
MTAGRLVNLYGSGSAPLRALFSTCPGCRVAGMMHVTAESASKYFRASSAQVVQPISLAKSGTGRRLSRRIKAP